MSPLISLVSSFFLKLAYRAIVIGRTDAN